MIQPFSLPLFLPFLFNFFRIVLYARNHNLPAFPYSIIKNLSSVRDERSFRGTTLIVASIIQKSRTGFIGGPEGARTPDLIHAMDALSQLRYRPMFCYSWVMSNLMYTHCTL